MLINSTRYWVVHAVSQATEKKTCWNGNGWQYMQQDEQRQHLTQPKLVAAMIETIN